MPADFYVGPSTAPDTYRLVRQLGGGGEGEVWQAVLQLSRRGRRSVAVKIIRPRGRLPDVDHWARVGHLLRGLSHPGLVRVTDVFVGPSRHRAGEQAQGASAYVVMDYVEGATLQEWILDNPRVSAAERLRMLLMVASALDHMHTGATTDVPVAHGDVKPSNIVVGPERETVLVDLGLVRLVDAAGTTGRSVPYTAPELRQPGARVTPEADRYAFAVTIAQVLTGRPPPLGPEGWLDPVTLQELLRAHPLTQRRHVLVHRIMDAITAPPEARPRALAEWLTGSLDSLSQVTADPADDEDGIGDRDPAGDTSHGHHPEAVPPLSHTDGGTSPASRPTRLLVLAAALGAVLVALAGALLTQTRQTVPPAVTPTVSASVSPTSAPRRDQYGCSGLTTLPDSVEIPPDDPASPRPPDVVYDADSYGPTARPFQLHPGGYIDQAFAATGDTVTAVAAVPGIDFRVGPVEAQLQYELWDLDGHQLGRTLTVHLDASNVNAPVVAEFDPPVSVRPGGVYYFRVINTDAAPAIGVYLRSPTGQRIAHPLPVCLVDADPKTGSRAMLERQGAVLSGRIGNGT